MITFQSLGRLGRMCNQMFSIMGTISIASRSQQSFGFPVWRNYDAVERFGSTEDMDLYKYFVNQLPEVPEGIEFQDMQYSWGYQDLYLPTGNWNLSSHFQCPAYFYQCPDLIKHYFRMVDEPADIDACALHIRRGDYDGSFHPLADKYYYTAALGHIPGSEILLFSDDLNQASDLLNNIGVDFTPIEKNGIESFKMMKKCRHFIGCNSSYSLMASLLGEWENKISVFPKEWFGPSWGDQYQRDYMAKDIYPQNCIIL